MERLDWTAKTNQYDLRVRRPGRPIEVHLILDRPRQGPEADLEFAVQWAKEDETVVSENWHVLSVTDMVLLVTYLPSTLTDRPDGPFFYNRDHYVVPDRHDNPRFFDAVLVHKQQPDLLRGYSFVVSHPQLDPQDDLRQHGLLRGDWQLQPGSIREIELEQHYQLTWQRQRLPTYYDGPAVRTAPSSGEATLTPAQTALLVELAQAGYVLCQQPSGWAVGKLDTQAGDSTSTYHEIVAGQPTPAAALLAAATQLCRPTPSRS